MQRLVKPNKVSRKCMQMSRSPRESMSCCIFGDCIFWPIEPYTPHSYGLWPALRHDRIHAATREIAKNATRAAAGAKCGITRSIFGVEGLRSCADGKDREVSVNCVNRVFTGFEAVLNQLGTRFEPALDQL